MWIRTCVFKLPLCENCAPQESHLYGLCTVWIQTWFFKLPFVRIVHHRYHICMVSHQCGCGHAAIRLDKRVPKVPHLNCFTIVQVFTFPAILNILPQVTCFHSQRFLPLRGSTLVSSALYCIKRYVTTKSALVHDWIIRSETCKAQAPLLKSFTNVSVKLVSVKMQALTHHVFVIYCHKP